MYGLRLLLDINQAEYLPYTEAAGVRLVVHNQTDEPFPDTFGYSAPVGLLSSFGLKTVCRQRLTKSTDFDVQKVVERRGPPYGTCMTKDQAQSMQEDWIYEEKYSVEVRLEDLLL